MTLTLNKNQKAELNELDALAEKLSDEASVAAENLAAIVSDLTDEIEERSEKWRESAAGQAAQDRIDTLPAASDSFTEAANALHEAAASLSGL
jgi:hypothetical protein